MVVHFNYNKLKGLMREKVVTQKDLAEKIGISLTSLNYKLNNIRAFDPCEMLAIQIALEISDEQFKEYFFTPDVRKVEKKIS